GRGPHDATPRRGDRWGGGDGRRQRPRPGDAAGRGGPHTRHGYRKVSLPGSTRRDGEGTLAGARLGGAGEGGAQRCTTHQGPGMDRLDADLDGATPPDDEAARVALRSVGPPRGLDVST